MRHRPWKSSLERRYGKQFAPSPRRGNDVNCGSSATLSHDHHRSLVDWLASSIGTVFLLARQAGARIASDRWIASPAKTATDATLVFLGG